MTNAELITALRCESVINDEHPRCESCNYGVVVCHGSREDVYGCDSRRIENDAADALEAADKRIAELESQLPKEGEWIIKPHGTYGQLRAFCSACGKHSGIGGIVSNQKKPYCPNCGAKMQTVTDCHTLEEGER